MALEPSAPSLSRITTIWTQLDLAHRGDATAAAAARRLLLERYGGAVRRYLTLVLRDPDAADELTQEFALGLIRGEFRSADRRRGRFRSYVKTALFHLVSKYRDRQRKLPSPLPAAFDVPAEPDEADDGFDRTWRDELLRRALAALADVNRGWHAALRCRIEAPDAPSAELAERVSAALGKPVSAEAARQMLHRGRERFAVLLADVVAHSLDPGTPEQVEDELSQLGLLDYCKDALGRGEQ